MIDIERYSKLKEEYGHVSSWTIWGKPTSGIKSNVYDLSIFEDENICNKLNDNMYLLDLMVLAHMEIRMMNPGKISIAVINIKMIIN